MDEPPKPLSVRVGRRALGGPHEGIPGWLARPLENLLLDCFVVLSQNSLLQDFLDTVDAKLQCASFPERNFAGSSWIVRFVEDLLGSPDVTLDFLDEGLAMRRLPEDKLGALLTRAASAWTVSKLSGESRLTRRVTPELQALAEKAAAREETAGRLLSAAWGHVGTSTVAAQTRAPATGRASVPSRRRARPSSRRPTHSLL